MPPVALKYGAGNFQAEKHFNLPMGVPKIDLTRMKGGDPMNKLTLTNDGIPAARHKGLMIAGHTYNLLSK